jgi:hypothetical protein
MNGSDRANDQRVYGCSTHLFRIDDPSSVAPKVRRAAQDFLEENRMPIRALAPCAKVTSRTRGTYDECGPGSKSMNAA